MNGDLDVIGEWSEIKLEILNKYAHAYTTILSKKQLRFIYIDGFAGAGQHLSRRTGDVVQGSPQIALNISPPFHEYHFVDLNPKRADQLRDLSAGRSNVYVYNGDCNEILLNEVFPRARYEDHARALCILDPYGLHLDWEVMRTAGQMKSVDLFLNFPVMDMNMNVLWNNPEKVDASQKDRMNSFWGDESWWEATYTTEADLFGYPVKTGIETVVQAFRQRLKKVASFGYVPEPMPMRNSKGGIVYYLFFASQVATADKIIKDIFRKY
jgi:three-Cys-motif partner protein